MYVCMYVWMDGDGGFQFTVHGLRVAEYVWHGLCEVLVLVACVLRTIDQLSTPRMTRGEELDIYQYKLQSMFRKGQEVSVKWGKKFYDGVIEKKIGQGYDVYFTADNSIGFVQNSAFIRLRKTKPTAPYTSKTVVTATKDARKESLDPPTLSEYEKQRLANIAKNQEYMVKLGLKRVISDMTEVTQMEKRARRARALVRVKDKSVAHVAEPRRSNRRLGKDPEYRKEQVDDFFSGLHALGLHRSPILSPAEKRQRHASRKSVVRVELTEAQRVNLDKFDIVEFEKFLRTTPHGRKGVPISQDNCRTVLRQVRLMVSGAGVGYHHWPADVFWRKGEPVQLHEDFDVLKEDARMMEVRHGRDLGNGWLLNHPLQKLQNFQLYMHEKALQRQDRIV